MLPSCCPCSTRSHASKESGVLRAVGQITFKETAPMIPNHTARRSKKGDKAPPGQASHSSRQRLGQNALVYRTELGLVAPVPETEDAGGEISSTHEALMLLACSVICYRFLSC